MIKKYTPFNIYNYPFPGLDTLRYLFKEFSDMKYILGICVSKIRMDGLYFKNTFKPEINLFNHSRLNGNYSIYSDQLSKARTIGGFYKMIDLEKEIILSKSEHEFIPINNVDITFSFQLSTLVPYT